MKLRVTTKICDLSESLPLRNTNIVISREEHVISRLSVQAYFVVSNSPGRLVDCRFLISRKPTLGRDINGEVALSSKSVDKAC